MGNHSPTISDYVSGGYYVLKAIPRPIDLSSSVLPDKLLTMSNCFTRVVCDIIQLQWDNYDNVREAIADEAREFGIPETQIPELVTWAKAQRNTNYRVYSELEPAFELRRRFITDQAQSTDGRKISKPFSFRKLLIVQASGILPKSSQVISLA